MANLSFDTSSVLAWLFESTLYVSLWICIILALKIATRAKLPAWWSYGLWLLLVFRMLLPWGLESPLSIFNFFPAPSVNDIYMPFLMGQVVSLQFASNTSVSLSLDKVFLLIWFLGILIFGGSIILKNLRFWMRVKRIPAVTDKDVLDLFEECRIMLSVRRKVRIVVSHRVKSPALFGYLKPRLLLPVNFLKYLEKDELRCVFLHELGHLKSHDIGVSWLVTGLQVIHWFNPFVWYAFHHMRIDQEVARDAYVLSRINQVNPADYANTIVDLLERFTQNRQLPSLAGIIENKSQIKKRIAFIMNFKRHTYKKTVVSVFLLSIVGLVFFTGSNGISGVNEKGGVNIPEPGSVFESANTLLEVDKPPRVIRAIYPKYPASAKEEEINGIVMIKFVVAPDGLAHEPTVVSAEPEGVFEDAALDALSKFIFEPAEKDGIPVACIVKIPMKFDLRE